PQRRRRRVSRPSSIVPERVDRSDPNDPYDFSALALGPARGLARPGAFAGFSAFPIGTVVAMSSRMRLHGHAASVSHTLRPVELRHVRPVQPLLFDVGSNPEWNNLGQTPIHVRLCFFLFELLELATTKNDTTGCDQFV